MTGVRELLLVGAIAGALSACGGESGPVTVRIFSFNRASGEYGEFDARLETLDDVTQMRGRTVMFVGNATIVLDAIAAQTDPKANRMLRAEGGMAPNCSFTDKDGVLHADDYDSLNMASAYWALEQARNQFLDLGIEPELLNSLNAYYHPRLQVATKLVPTFFVLTDNAAYAPAFDGFLIVPHILMPGTPFTTNLGVMTHEYGHKVFNRLVEHGAPVQSWLRNDWTAAAQRQYQGIDEGFADYFGFLQTGDTDYIRATLGGLDLPSIDRDMSVKRVMSAEFADQVLNQPDPNAATTKIFDPHELGAFVAAALWRFGEDIHDHRRVALAILAAERDLGEAIERTPKYDFSTLEMLSRIASRFEGSERSKLCAIYEERFDALIQRDRTHSIGACP